MSASRERKKRMVESEQAAPQQAKKTKKKLSEGWIFAIIVILIPVIVFGVIFGVQASWRNATVVSVGDHKVSTTEFNYFYRGALNSIYSTYGSYISLLGIDTSTPLDEQSYAGSDEYDTWADFLADSAKTSAVDAYTVYDKAVEAGFSLSDDDKASIDNEINTLKTYAGVYSMDLDEYIEAMFGKGCNEKNYRHYLEVSKLHDAYIESLTYTEDERNARYEQDTTEFDTVTYYSYAVKASDFETKSDSSTDSTEATTSTEPSEEAIAAAREAANAMVSDFMPPTGSTPRRSPARRSSLRRTTRSMSSSSRASTTTTIRPSTPCSSTSRRMLPTRNTRTARRPPRSASPSLRLP